MKDLEEKELAFEEDTQKDKFLTFVLGKEVFGIDIKNVTEIIGLQPITEVPDLPHYVKGIINLRGKIIPVMDVRLRFKKNFKDYNDKTCIVVVDMDNLQVGLIVDTVADVVGIPQENIASPPAIGSNNNRYIKGIGKIADEVKLLLDCKKLLEGKELEVLTSVIE